MRRARSPSRSWNFPRPRWWTGTAPFTDREHAGRQLAVEVAGHLDGTAGPPLVLALPRGGVPVAVPVAKATGGDLDLVIARKIGLPGRPELGVGALAEDGPPVFDHQAMVGLGLTEADFADIVERERAEIHRRIRRYRDGRPAPDPAGREVVVVDDGLATGVTARAALRWLHARRPRSVILAVPVCSLQSYDALTPDVDTLVCLRCPTSLGSVGQWYADFHQLTDEDVDRALHSA